MPHGHGQSSTGTHLISALTDYVMKCVIFNGFELCTALASLTD